MPNTRTCVRYVIFAIFLSFFPDRCHLQSSRREDKQNLLDLSSAILNDAARKGETVWVYRKAFRNYLSFSMGERVYVVRARFAAMIRTYYLNFKNRNMFSLNQMLRSSLLLQKRTESIYTFVADIEDFDVSVGVVSNPLNWSRFDEHPCHVAGPPCDLVPIRSGYRRQNTMDQALQLIESRRNFIRKEYNAVKQKPTINIDAKLNLSLDYEYKYSNSSRSNISHNQDMNLDSGNLAPDFMT